MAIGVGVSSKLVLALAIVCAAALLAGILFEYGPVNAGHAGVFNPSFFGYGKVNISNQTYRVLLATNQTQQLDGLMYATEADLQGLNVSGMMFVFQRSADECFWMSNTQIPLRQAWIESNVIVYVYSATPYSTASKCYNGDEVLEVPAGSNVPVNVGEVIRLGD